MPSNFDTQRKLFSVASLTIQNLDHGEKTMSFSRVVLLGSVGLGIVGCSAITKGTTQEIFINTNPRGATCTLVREGETIGTVDSTPGRVNVSKTKHDIAITCDRPGYQTATYYNKSGWESGSGGAGIALDVLLTLGLSSAIDSATGADNRYDSPVNITMIPSEGMTPASGAPTSTPAPNQVVIPDGSDTATAVDSPSPATQDSTSYTNTPLVPTGVSKDTVMQVQMALKKLGYDPGPVTGEYTQTTKITVHDFQSNQGLVSNGTLDGPTLQALGIEGN
jgi:Putative peptidoglycan binding domain